MSEERAQDDKAKGVLRHTANALKTATGTLTGKNVEQQVAEYSELYTQVLLGLHRDLEAQGRKLQDQATEIEVLKRQVASMRMVRIVAIAAFVIALVSAGGALWAAL